MEIFLYYCGECGTVKAGPRKLKANEKWITEQCHVCRGPERHYPVAIALPEKLQGFLASYAPVRFVTLK